LISFQGGTMNRLRKFFKKFSQPGRKMSFTITFSEKSFARLKVLLNLSELKDVSELLLRALGWYDMAVECLSNGGTITLENTDGSEETMRNYQDVIEWLNRNGIK